MGNSMGNVSIDNREFSLNIDGKAIFLIAQIILVILKIAGVLNVSWWVIFLPILIPVGFLVLLFVVFLVACLISPKFKAKLDKYNERCNNEKED